MNELQIGQTVSQAELDQLARTHGGVRGVSPIPPPAGLHDQALDQYNAWVANPPLKYTFNDGTVIQVEGGAIAQTLGEGENGRSVGYTVQQYMGPEPSTRTTQQVSAPSNQPYLVQQDPRTGAYSATKNPNYDSAGAQLEAQQKQQQLQNQADANKRAQEEFDYRKQVDDYNAKVKQYEALAKQRQEQAQYEYEKLRVQVEQGKLDAQAANDQFDRWYKTEVLMPYQQAQEARARTEELQRAEQEQRRRQEAEAKDQIDRLKFGYGAGQDAVQTALKTLPYQVGPAFAEEYANVLNAAMNDPSADVSFSPDAFTIQMPDFNAIAQQGAAAAVAQWSPYAQRIQQAQGTGTPIPTTDYSQINGGQLAPASPPPPPPPPIQLPAPPPPPAYPQYPEYPSYQPPPPPGPPPMPIT